MVLSEEGAAEGGEHGEAQVAKDGKSYTTTVKGTTAKGEPIDVLMVFDKQ